MKGPRQFLRRSRGVMKRFILFSVRKMLKKQQVDKPAIKTVEVKQNETSTMSTNSTPTLNHKGQYSFQSDKSSTTNLINAESKITAPFQKTINPINAESNITAPYKKTIQYNSIGLINLGNTCYMNAAIQTIINTSDLNEQLLSGSINSLLHPKNKGIATTYQTVMKNMWFNKSTNPQNPKPLKGIIANTIQKFRGYGQEDSQEFLRALLDLLHQDLNRVRAKVPYKELDADLSKSSLQQISNDWFNYFQSRENSIVTDLFQGQLLNLVECQICKNQSVAFDNFQELSLSLPSNIQKVSIEDLLKEFFKKEVLTNSYSCSKCKQVSKSLRNFSLWRLPKNLIIHFKRFQYGPMQRKKIDVSISFPLQHFSLSDYSKSQSQVKYQLYGIIHHYGSLNYGHYTAECRNASDGKWYSLNDESVYPINITSKGYSTLGSISPYVLLYKQSE